MAFWPGVVWKRTEWQNPGSISMWVCGVTCRLLLLDVYVYCLPSASPPLRCLLQPLPPCSFPGSLPLKGHVSRVCTLWLQPGKYCPWGPGQEIRSKDRGESVVGACVSLVVPLNWRSVFFPRWPLSCDAPSSVLMSALSLPLLSWESVTTTLLYLFQSPALSFAVSLQPPHISGNGPFIERSSDYPSMRTCCCLSEASFPVSSCSASVGRWWYLGGRSH